MIMSTAGNKRNTRAFTLIELLVVVGLIGLLTGGIGIAMRDGSPTSALRAGQNTLVGLLSSARGQAALTQADAMLIINATPGENSMRELQVVVRASGDTWRQVGAPVVLPKGIYVVPPVSGTGGVELASGWPATRVSDGFITTSPSVSPSNTAEDVTPEDSGYNPFQNKKYLKFQLFGPLGTTTGAGRLLVTTGSPTSHTAALLDNPNYVRGVSISRYGVPILVNEAESFD